MVDSTTRWASTSMYSGLYCPCFGGKRICMIQGTYLLKNNWRYSCTMFTEGCLIGHYKNDSRGAQILYQSESHILSCDLAYHASRCVHRILDALVSQNFYGAYVKQLTRNTHLPEPIWNNDDYYPYFRDCIGAIDGTHIPAFIPEDIRAPFRNRKGTVSQNVLAACSLDFKFVYVLSGWEGSASDSMVYQDAG
jgi:hypothetical protein